MKLKEYFDTTGVGQKFLAKKAEISESAMSQYSLGQKVPNIKTAWKIHKATNGEVTFIDWLSEETDVDSDASIQKEAKNNKNKDKSKKRV